MKPSCRRLRFFTSLKKEVKTGEKMGEGKKGRPKWDEYNLLLALHFYTFRGFIVSKNTPRTSKATLYIPCSLWDISLSHLDRLVYLAACVLTGWKLTSVPCCLHAAVGWRLHIWWWCCLVHFEDSQPKPCICPETSAEGKCVKIYLYS